MTILLDPWSLTWAGNINDDAQAEAYVERLTNIFELSKQDMLSVMISDESMELLIADGVYPLITELPAPLWPGRGDVYRLVTSLLQKLPRISQTGVLAVLIEETACEPEVGFPTSARHAAHISELASIALIAHERSKIEAPPILSSYAAEDSVHLFSISVMDVECVSAPEARLGNYYGSVRVRTNLLRCVADWSSADLLLRGFVEQAIALEVWKASGAEGLNPFAVTGWTLGADFTRNIGDCGVACHRARADALLRSCANIIRKENLRATHPLRSGSSGASPQVVRSCDGASAWRADIDYEYHLYYWSQGGHVEFANVVVHNDFGITQ